MPMKQKPTAEVAAVPETLEDLPCDAEQLSAEEAEAARGGWFFSFSPAQQEVTKAQSSLSPEQQRG